MFTGLIEEIGSIASLTKNSNSLLIGVKANKVIENVSVGDSIAVNGVCLTVVKFSDSIFYADVMHETVKRTNLNLLKVGDKVNLEKSLTLNSFMGGHLVLADVETTGKIISIIKDEIAYIYKIELDSFYLKYIVEKGRITVDGASLTVIDCGKNFFTFSLIPHSQENLIIKYKTVGDLVNIETDIIAKHIEKLLKSNQEKGSSLSYNTLLENGFI